MSSRSIKLIFAFLLFMFGFLSFILSMLGLQFKFLRWLEALPTLTTVLLKTGMMIGGIILAYLTVNPPKND